MTGVAVTAVNQDDIDAQTGSVGGGAVAANITGTVVVTNATTSAFIADGASVNPTTTGDGSGQNVLVAAGDDFHHLGVAAACGVGRRIRHAGSRRDARAG